MAVKGVFASDAGIQGDRVGDFASSLIKVMPTGTAQLLALSSGMKTKDSSEIVVTWFEQNHVTGRQKLTEAVADGADTSFIVDDASAYVAGTVLLVEEHGEYVLVSSISGNTLTVIRGHAGTTAAAITINTYLQRLGTAHEEGSSRPTAVANSGFPRSNYMQIFRNAWDVTGTAKAVEFHTGDVVARNRADAGMFHAEDQERSLIWGKKAIGVKDGKPFRSMDGINAQITTNVEAAGSTTSWSDMTGYLRAVFENNIKNQPNERIAFCGNHVIQVLDEIARYDSQMNISVGETSFGLKIFKWMSPFGDISLMTHPLMNQSPLWTKQLYIYHPAAIQIRYLRRTATDSYDKDGSRAGVDADFGVLTTESSVEYHAEKTGSVITGFTAGVAQT